MNSLERRHSHRNSSRLQAMVCALALLGATVTSAIGANCSPAAAVRVVVDDVIYNVPSELRPRIDPASAVVTKAQRGPTIYCQSPGDSPIRIERFSLSSAALVQLSSEDARLALLRYVDPFVVRMGPPGGMQVDSGGVLVEGGAFRRIDRNKHYQLISTMPLIQGSVVSASCVRAPIKIDTDTCTISAELLSGSMLRVDVILSDVPLSRWPELFKQIDAAIKLLEY